MKERYAVTDMMKLANRMQFGIPEESSLGDGLGEGYGMLGQAGSGKLRVSAAQNKLAAKVAKKYAFFILPTVSYFVPFCSLPFGVKA